MRFAYADPPYLGEAERIYGDATYDNLDAHRLLIDSLQAYDGWALSLHERSLRAILPLCPSEARTMPWVKTWTNLGPSVTGNFVPWAWEPVIVKPGRLRHGHGIRDWYRGPPLMQNFKGAKPPYFCRWLFAVLGMERRDELIDLFVGSGAVRLAWNAWRSEQEFSWAPEGKP